MCIRDRYTDIAGGKEDFTPVYDADGNQTRIRTSTGIWEAVSYTHLDVYKRQLYDATLERTFLCRAVQLTRETVIQYYDSENSGFYLSGTKNETLLFRPKECYDCLLYTSLKDVLRPLYSKNSKSYS